MGSSQRWMYASVKSFNMFSRHIFFQLESRIVNICHNFVNYHDIIIKNSFNFNLYKTLEEQVPSSEY